jgi:hypothetical protein
MTFGALVQRKRQMEYKKRLALAKKIGELEKEMADSLAAEVNGAGGVCDCEDSTVLFDVIEDGESKHHNRDIVNYCLKCGGEIFMG